MGYHCISFSFRLSILVERWLNRKFHSEMKLFCYCLILSQTYRYVVVLICTSSVFFPFISFLDHYRDPYQRNAQSLKQYPKLWILGTNKFCKRDQSNANRPQNRLRKFDTNHCFQQIFFHFVSGTTWLRSVTGCLGLALVFMGGWGFGCYFIGAIVLVLAEFSFWRGALAAGLSFCGVQKLS